MADRLVTTAQFTDLVQASLAKQLLADFGIESVLAGQNFAGMLSPLANIELQVLENQSQRALEILESQKEQDD